LYRPNQSKVDGVFDKWDQFESLKAYGAFTKKWLMACKRILKNDGTIWVIGSYHNIYKVGAIMQDLGFWFLNDIVWIKSNPMPNFRGTRFTNAHETLLWAAKSKQAKYTFHYKAMKTFNGDVQMRSDWHIPICSGKERIKVNGKKAHSTQKPVELLMRVILSSTNVGDIVVDPFSGSGTTAAVAKRLGRNFIGIEQEAFYVQVANERIAKIQPISKKYLHYKIEAKAPRVPFGNLIEKGLVSIGETLYSKDKKFKAIVLANASIETTGNLVASIHRVSASLLKKQSNNGWKFWHVERDNKLVVIDNLRSIYINTYLTTNTATTIPFPLNEKQSLNSQTSNFLQKKNYGLH